jgi:hypothetical protein
MRAEWTLLPLRTCAGVSRTPRTITWGYTAPVKRPGTVMQTRRQREHHSNTLIQRPCSTQHPKCTMFRIQPQASPQERIKSTQEHGLAPQSWRAIASEVQAAAHLSQHTNDQRAKASPKHDCMRHWHAEPLLAQIMPPVCLHQSPSSGAPASSSSSRSVYLCAAVDRTEVQTYSNPP